MTLSIEFTVIDNLRDSASRGQHVHVIEETIAIDIELQNLQLHLLDLRARSYVACAQFSDALETATKMQQMNPASALGYLCQGYIHMEQGRYVAATHVYDQAPERVNKRDPLYGTIQTAKRVAIQQEERRKDFICDLPMDISDHIIQEVFIDEEFIQQREYVMVSWAWWRRIMASNYLAYTISPHLPLDETNGMVIESFTHTRSLTLMSCVSQLARLFQKYSFSSLAKLTICSPTFDTFKESLLILEWIGSQLMDLVLDYHAHHSNDQHRYAVTLQQILEKCPNLISLYCHTTINMSYIDETYPKLQELKLYGVAGTVDSQHMMMNRKHLPGLKTLDMVIEGSSRPLTLGDSWLPSIRILGYGNRPSTYYRGLDLTRCGQQGLILLSITQTKHLFSLDDIAPLIIGHHATLQVLVLTFQLDTRQTQTMVDAMHQYRDIEFEQLKILRMNHPTFIDNMRSYCDFISWVIERAPHLHTVVLDGYTMSDIPLKALSKCMQLRNLYFGVRNTNRPSNYDTLVTEFLRNHVDYMADKGGSRMESIMVQLHEAHPTLIAAIRQLKCLESFELFATNLAQEPFTRLLGSLCRGCKNLRALRIVHNGRIPNRVLYYISGLSNLRNLAVSGDMRDVQAGVLSLQGCRHLKNLRIDTPIDPDIRSLLRASNSGLEIARR